MSVFRTTSSCLSPPALLILKSMRPAATFISLGKTDVSVSCTSTVADGPFGEDEEQLIAKRAKAAAMPTKTMTDRHLREYTRKKSIASHPDDSQILVAIDKTQMKKRRRTRARRAVK